MVKKLKIISLKENRARIIDFDERVTLIISQNEDGTSLNRTGKSMILKSIYFSLGAELSSYPTNWKELDILTVLEFRYNNENYIIYRRRNYFLLKKSNGELKHFSSISKLKDFYVDFFNFQIKLANKTTTSHLYPGAIFLPFYIDQDRGWFGKWESFKDNTFYKNWRKEILLFHAGMKPNRHYEILEEQSKIIETNTKSNEKLVTLRNIFEEQFNNYKDVLDINIDIASFDNEIEKLLTLLDSKLNEKNNYRVNLLKLNNKAYEYKINYQNAIKALEDLEEDANYMNEVVNFEDIECPTCGTRHKNNIINKFQMYTEIEESRNLVNYFQNLQIENSEKIVNTKKEFDKIKVEINEIEKILNSEREKVTFKDVLKSEGARELLEKVENQIKMVEKDIEIHEGKLSLLTKEKTKITKSNSDLKKEYNDIVKQYIFELDVKDVDIKKVRNIGDTIESTGVDTPRLILAEHFAHYDMIKKYSSSVVCPMVIDTPLQQEPGSVNISKIIKFLLNERYSDSQLIVASTEIHDFKFDGKIIRLIDERNLLGNEHYELCIEEIDFFLSRSICLKK